MQSKVELLNAYANILALSLSSKQHLLNSRSIQHNGTHMFSLDMIPTTLDDYKYGNLKEDHFCNLALLLAQSTKKLNNLVAQRHQILIQQSFGISHSENQKEEILEDTLFNSYIQNFKELDFNQKSNKSKLRKFVLENYRKCPQQIGKLVFSLDIRLDQVKQWIQYGQKQERKLNLMEEILKISQHQEVTYEQFKKLAKTIYKTRLFRASDKWCINYIRKYGLGDVIRGVPQQQE